MQGGDGEEKVKAEGEAGPTIGGGVHCDFVKPCSRCTITTVDQTTGTFGKQPLQTLGEMRSGAVCGFATATRRKEWMDQPMFGWNVVSRAKPGAAIRVGDVVSVTATRKWT